MLPKIGPRLSHVESEDVKDGDILTVTGDAETRDGEKAYVLSYVADAGVPPSDYAEIRAFFGGNRIFLWGFSGYHGAGRPIGIKKIICELYPDRTRIALYDNETKVYDWDNAYDNRDALDNLKMGSHEFHATFSGFELETPQAFLVKASPKIFYFRYSRIVELGLLQAPLKAAAPEILSYETRA